jgi:hypothetical protein
VLGDEIQDSAWFLFHNPFRCVEALRFVLKTLFALLRLQNREKFI